MDETGEVICRAMRRAELREVLRWAAAEGWNPGRGDAAAFWAADPGGFFVAEEAATGQAIAAISVVNHDPAMAFLGLYLCLPDWRGRGIGYALWRHALHHAGGRTIGLDGVAAQQANYARSGFRLAGATRRLEGALPGQAGDAVRPFAASDAPALALLDGRANGYTRTGFLAAWLRSEEGRQSLVLEEAGAVTGMVTIRRCLRGCKIGPLIAAGAGPAWRLLQAAAAALPAEVLIVDVPEGNAMLAARLEAAGFRETFRTARMYRGPAPEGDGSLQAVGTLELG